MPKNRKYLEDINYQDWRKDMKKDKRNKKWKKERKKYGFDSRDTWNLDSTMAELLYERLCMFDEVNFIDTDFHTIEFEGSKYTQQEAMDLLKELLKGRLLSDDFSKIHDSEVRAWNLWVVLIEAGIMWW